MNIKYDYSKLRGKIKEKLGNEKEFALKMDLSGVTISAKLNGSIEFKQSEMLKACDILNIPLQDMHKYFFSPTSKEKLN